MKRIFIFFFFLIVTTTIVVAQPRFVADNEILKVGEVQFQQPKTFTLAFSNKGDQPFAIQEVHPSCGCMKVTYPVGDIQPGEKGELLVTLDALTLGSFYKDIELVTTASDKPVYMAIQGYVVKELSASDTDFPVDLGNIRLEKSYLEFDDVHQGQYPVAELRVLNRERTAFRPQLMHMPHFLTFTCEPEAIPPGKVGTLRVQLHSDQLPIMGLNQASIYMARYMGDKVSTTNEIGVSAVLLPDFSNLTEQDVQMAPRFAISENQIPMGEAAPAGTRKPNVYDVKISNEGATPLQIKQVQVFSKALDVHLKNRTLAPGKSTRLRITLHPHRLTMSKNRPRVLLITNDPNHSKEIIEVVAKKN